MNQILLFIFTKLASTVGLFAAISCIILWLLVQGQNQAAVSLFLTTLALTLTVTLFKKVFKVARPASATITPSSYAFPSGHAAGATFLAMIIIILTRHIPTPLWYITVFTSSLIAVSIAYSRLYFKVHTWLQVTTGAVIGLLFSLLFAMLI